MQVVRLSQSTHGAWNSPIKMGPCINGAHVLEQVGQHGILESMDSGHMMP